MFTNGGKTLKVHLDASGQTWHDVPGYGRVNWPVEQITEHAREVWSLHRPDRPIFKIRLLWHLIPTRVLPYRECKICLTPWMCRQAWWATRWFDSLERGWRHMVDAE
jgi:hypothetical protein